MTTEPEQLNSEFASPSQADQAAMVDAGRSLFAEVRSLREQVAQLCQAVRGLVQLQSVLNQGVQQLLKNNGGGADFGVI